MICVDRRDCRLADGFRARCSGTGFRGYSYLWRTAESKPFSPAELLQWFASQGYEIKLGIVGALLTIVSFAIALWKRQKELELRIDASKVIQERFQRALRLLINAESYLHALIQSIKSAAPTMNGMQVLAHSAFQILKQFSSTRIGSNFTPRCLMSMTLQ